MRFIRSSVNRNIVRFIYHKFILWSNSYTPFLYEQCFNYYCYIHYFTFIMFRRLYTNFRHWFELFTVTRKSCGDQLIKYHICPSYLRNAGVSLNCIRLSNNALFTRSSHVDRWFFNNGWRSSCIHFHNR